MLYVIDYLMGNTNIHIKSKNQILDAGFAVFTLACATCETKILFQSFSNWTCTDLKRSIAVVDHVCCILHHLIVVLKLIFRQVIAIDFDE